MILLPSFNFICFEIQSYGNGPLALPPPPPPLSKSWEKARLNRVNVLLSSKIYMVVQLFIYIEDNVTGCCYSTYVVMYTVR